MKRQPILIALLATILVFMFFSVANAQQPEIVTFAFHDVFEVPCDGFNAEFDDLGEGRITTFSDENSNPDEYVGQIRIAGIITHSGTGQSFSDQAVINFSGDLPLDEIGDDSQGIMFRFNAPGYGVVTLAVGRIVTDENGNAIFTAGQNGDELNEQGVFIVCEGLADL